MWKNWNNKHALQVHQVMAVSVRANKPECFSLVLQSCPQRKLSAQVRSSVSTNEIVLLTECTLLPHFDLVLLSRFERCRILSKWKHSYVNQKVFAHSSRRPHHLLYEISARQRIKVQEVVPSPSFNTMREDVLS